MKSYLMSFCLNRIGLLGAVVIAASPLFANESAPPLKALGRMPIKEVTVFKDGHAFVAEEGNLPTDSAGNVLMDSLPAPVIGTFWPFAADKRAKLTSVTAGQRRVSVEHTALSIPELLEANPGAETIITEDNTNRYSATIVGIPKQSSEELAAVNPPGSPESLPKSGSIVLLRTSEGLKAVSISRIQDVTFKDTNRLALAQEEFRDLLTLKLDWGKNGPASTADVGLFYLQRGIRWIPSYKVTLDGKGNASVKLQATLINELADLDDTAVNLVVGVPSFAFKDTLDPMALQQTAAQLSQYFQANPNGFQNGALANNFANSIMSQQVGGFRGGEYRAAGGNIGAEDTETSESGRNEDLFVYNAGHVTMKKGERMVITLAEFTIPYKDVFTLEFPFTTPTEMNRNMNDPNQREMARLLNSPKVMHKVRLSNKSHYPLTTAPALMLREGRVLAQGMMTYTAVGATSDLTITTAVDISAKKSDLESHRTPNAMNHNDREFSRVDMTGKITLVNHRPEPAELEITRYVLGNPESASHSGKAEKINSFDDADSGTAFPSGWNYYGLPNWWTELNGVGRVTWNLKLDAGQSTDLDYKWYYYWQ
jgi:hypothetical protein